jgi:hypothetical protein
MELAEQVNAVQNGQAKRGWPFVNRGEWLTQLTRGPWVDNPKFIPELVASPWRVEKDGVAWSAATDGRLIIFVREGESDSHFPAAPNGVPKKLLIMFEPRGKVQWSGPVCQIKEFAGEPVWSAPCKECLGRSAVSDHVCCAACENSGQKTPDIRPGWLWDVLFDRNYLACGLAGIPGDAEVTVRLDNNEQPVFLTGDWWRLALMPIDPGSEGEQRWKNEPCFGPV